MKSTKSLPPLVACAIFVCMGAFANPQKDIDEEDHGSSNGTEVDISLSQTSFSKLLAVPESLLNKRITVIASIGVDRVIGLNLRSCREHHSLLNCFDVVQIETNGEHDRELEKAIESGNLEGEYVMVSGDVKIVRTAANTPPFTRLINSKVTFLEMTERFISIPKINQ